MFLREVMDKIVSSSLIAFNGMLTSHLTICQHIIIMLHTILVSTRNFVPAKQRNNIFELFSCLPEKAKAIELPFCTKGIRKKKTMKFFDKDWADKLAASDRGSCHKQHEFEEGQDLEALSF